MRTSVNYSYSGILQIMALSSVLGVPVETIYPDQNYKLLPIYQNLLKPRCWSNPGDSAVVRILWTSTLGWLDRSKEFVVNHFVPLFKRGNEVCSMQNTATETTTSRTTVEETENPWRIFTRRRPSKQRVERQDTKKTIPKDEITKSIIIRGIVLEG